MAKENRPTITLECSECHERNYSTTKNVKKQKEKLELKKYCRKCKVQTLHKETK